MFILVPFLFYKKVFLFMYLKINSLSNNKDDALSHIEHYCYISIYNLKPEIILIKSSAN